MVAFFIYMAINNLTPIWEYEQTKDSDFILERIFEFLFSEGGESNGRFKPLAKRRQAAKED